MAGARYAIPDEPLPGRMERWIVDPMWPLFAQMFGGSWLSLPWFVFNGVALGSPDRRREWLLAGLSLLGSAGLLFLLVAIAGRVAMTPMAVRLSLLAVLALKLGVAYALYLSQARAFELWRHFGGVPRNGALPAIGGLFAEAALLAVLAPWPLLQRVLE